MALTQMDYTGNGSGAETGVVTIPNNTTDVVTINFNKPCSRFMAVKFTGSTTYTIPNGVIVSPLDKETWGLSKNFDQNWYTTGAGDTGGITFSADGKSVSLQQPINYFAGEYIYFAE